MVCSLRPKINSIIAAFAAPLKLVWGMEGWELPISQ